VNPRAVSPDALSLVLADGLNRHPGGLRVAVDGAPAAGPHELAAALVTPLRALGRDAIHVRADRYWRDASLRYEFGRTDVDAYATSWLDVTAVRRELLEPLGPGGSRDYLPSLRDPATNRATREPRAQAAPTAILLFSGELLQSYDLPFDYVIHLALSAAARRRRTPAELAWTLPAFDAYDRDCSPVDSADAVVHQDDPKRPAISWADPEPASDR
jgi:hypothetical protein